MQMEITVPENLVKVQSFIALWIDCIFVSEHFIARNNK